MVGLALISVSMSEEVTLDQLREVKYATQYSISDCLRANARNGPLILCRKLSSKTRGSQGGMSRYRDYQQKSK